MTPKTFTRELCRECGGNGVVNIPGGVSVCSRCDGDCFEVQPSPAVVASLPVTETEQLFKDHSVALGFVREIAAEQCSDADCGHCLPCRANRWLNTAGASDAMQNSADYWFKEVVASLPVQEDRIDWDSLARGVKMLGVLPTEHPQAAAFNEALSVAANYLRAFKGHEENLPKFADATHCCQGGPAFHADCWACVSLVD